MDLSDRRGPRSVEERSAGDAGGPRLRTDRDPASSCAPRNSVVWSRPAVDCLLAAACAIGDRRAAADVIAAHQAPSQPPERTPPRRPGTITLLDSKQRALGAMDQHWQGFGYYYSQTNRADGHGPPAGTHGADAHSAPLLDGVHASGSHQRANTFPQRQSSFQPPRAPSTGPSPAPNGSPHHLPPFAQFYPQHYQPTQSPTQGSHSSGYSHSSAPYVPSTSPNTAYSYTSGSHILSPASGSGSRGPHAAPPPHSYPPPQALATSFATYSTSPHPRQLSPTSPASRAPLAHSKRRSRSASYSNGSWDDDGGGKHGDGLGETNEKEPWGMPQDEYRALNPRDKKQVRNRIGARRFRAKRKDYVASLEASIQTRNDEIDALRAQLESARSEIAGYRDRLGLPLAGAENGGLGLQGAR